MTVERRQARKTDSLRIGITVSPEEKKRLEKAAKSYRMSVSAFVAAAAIHQATDWVEYKAQAKKYGEPLARPAFDERERIRK